MDDMSQYMQQMNAAAASQSLSDASVAAQNAKEQAKTEYQRFKQGVVEGVTGPLGIDLLEKTVEKGGLKVAEKVGLGNAFKDWQEGGKGVQGLANAARGAIGRVTGKSVALSPDSGGAVSTARQLAQQAVQNQGRIPVAQPGRNAGGGPASDDDDDDTDAPLQRPVTQSQSTTSPDDNVGDDFVKVDASDTVDADVARKAVVDGNRGVSDMEKMTAASAEDDFNPYGLVITAGLAIGTLFAGIFGHHRDGLPKHPPVPPPVMNASTQFGVAQ